MIENNPQKHIMMVIQKLHAAGFILGGHAICRGGTLAAWVAIRPEDNTKDRRKEITSLFDEVVWAHHLNVEVRFEVLTII